MWWREHCRNVKWTSIKWSNVPRKRHSIGIGIQEHAHGLMLNTKTLTIITYVIRKVSVWEFTSCAEGRCVFGSVSNTVMHLCSCVLYLYQFWLNPNFGGRCFQLLSLNAKRLNFMQRFPKIDYLSLLNQNWSKLGNKHNCNYQEYIISRVRHFFRPAHRTSLKLRRAAWTIT